MTMNQYTPASIATVTLKRYRVWHEGQKPEQGELVREETGFLARQHFATLRGIPLTSVMARRAF